jgi:hypothetical protein
MPTRDQVQDLLDKGHSFQTAGRALGVPAGQAYMIATGRPADGSGPPAPDAVHDERLRSGSPQQLVHPPSLPPSRNAEVMAWVRERAARELRQDG